MPRYTIDDVGENNVFDFHESSILKYSIFQIHGDNNRIIVEDDCRVTNQKICIYGDNNTVLIRNGSKLRGVPGKVDEQCILIKGSQSKVLIGKRVRLQGELVLKGVSKEINIGDFSTLGNVYFLVAENTNLNIGKDCMFSHGISVRTSDSHSIINSKTGKRTNYAKDIVIGDHVWIGMNVLLTRGAIIPTGCVVATGAVVTKPFHGENCSIGGIPARVLSENITWDRRLLK
jgi:acetyltransferase-like isoleucine patch superfamily enzyme